MHLISIMATQAVELGSFAGDSSALQLGGALELGKGAIIGAMLAGLAFLAGVTVLRSSSAAFCALLMVLIGGALETIWLGLIPKPAPALMFLLQGMFAAAALIFLSSTIRLIRNNSLLGGLMFAAAISVLGIGVINIVLSGEATGLLRVGLALVGAGAVGLSAFGALRGDSGARIILPGAVAAAAAPLLIASGATGPLALAAPALFAIGILCASLGSLGDPARSLISSSDAHAGMAFSPSESAARSERNMTAASAPDPRISENQLAQVLDYAGVAVWDWSASASHQTLSFSDLMGADSDGAFTPDAFKAFVHDDDASRLLKDIYGHEDGGFDEVIKLKSGKRVRMRGARAVDESGNLERVVVFLEEATADTATPVGRDEALRLAAASLTGAATAIPKSRFKGFDIADAIENNRIEAAFQPIVSFDDKKIRGSEALVRWTTDDTESSSSLSTEDIVESAIAAGKGRALAKIMIAAAAEHVAARIKKGDKTYFAAFNVSPSQIMEEGFVDDVKAAIDEHKLPAKSLVLELTEAESLSDGEKIGDVFKALSSAGVALAFDDFGAGYSSLSNLHKFNFDYLKVDKSFINDIVVDEGKKKIVSALVGLGREFGMTIIAEGIESKEAADVACEIGCGLGQGYHLGAPSIKRGGVKTKDGDEMVLDKTLKVERSSGGLLSRSAFSFGKR